MSNFIRQEEEQNNQEICLNEDLFNLFHEAPRSDNPT